MSGSCQSRRLATGSHSVHPYERTSSGPAHWSVSCHRRHHSITSSAWASSVGGTLRPSAFAVLRLMIILDLLAARPAGLQAWPPRERARIGSGYDSREDARTVADEPACLHEFTNVVHGRYVPTRRARDNFGGLTVEEGIDHDTSALAWIG